MVPSTSTPHLYQIATRSRPPHPRTRDVGSRLVLVGEGDESAGVVYEDVAASLESGEGLAGSTDGTAGAVGGDEDSIGRIEGDELVAVTKKDRVAVASRDRRTTGSQASHHRGWEF